MDKARRRRRILDHLAQTGVHSQEQLRELLAADGVEVTQATLSRDLRELAVVKGPDGYTVIGAAPVATLQTNGRHKARELEHALRAHLLSVATAGNLLILRTGPGHAGALAVELDGARLQGVVGSLAGDDTIFIAAETPQRATSLGAHLRSLARLD